MKIISKALKKNSWRTFSKLAKKRIFGFKSGYNQRKALFNKTMCEIESVIMIFTKKLMILTYSKRSWRKMLFSIFLRNVRIIIIFVTIQYCHSRSFQSRLAFGRFHSFSWNHDMIRHTTSHLSFALRQNAGLKFHMASRIASQISPNKIWWWWNKTFTAAMVLSVHFLILISILM